MSSAHKVKNEGLKTFKIKLKKGDTVMVRAGKYKGRTGKIEALHPRLNMVTVEGINIVKKHKKPTKDQSTGGIVEITKPIWVGKVGIVDPNKNSKPSRIGIRVAKDGTKSRYFKLSGKEIK